MNGSIYAETVEKLLKIRLVSQERAREVLSERQELDSSELSYAGADENPDTYINTANRPQAAQRESFAPQNRQVLQYGPGPGDEDGADGLNREQRRRMKKDQKKKRIKI
jgi:hypothetical protein